MELMFLVYISLSILSFAAALFFLTLTMQPADDARYTAMDLFLALLFQVLSAWLLVQLPAVAAVLNGPASFWILMAIELILGLIWVHLSKRIHFSSASMNSLQKPLLKLFFWLPEEAADSDDELVRLIEASSVPEMEEQREVLENALDLNDTSLDEICTHRSDMVCLSMKEDPSKWKQIIMANRHTFYPITNESDDDIVGVLDTRDYFRLNGWGKKTIFDHTVDKPLFVAESNTADELLRMMKQRHTYIAIVLDEYGGVVGLVTLHDIIEELFGDLSEEEEKRQADIVRLPRGVWRINGEADLDDVSKALGMDLHLDDFETFSGYVLGSMGYIPEDGSQLETRIGPLSIQIRRIQGHRIRQALVKVEDEPKGNPAPESTPTGTAKSGSARH